MPSVYVCLLSSLVTGLQISPLIVVFEKKLRGVADGSVNPLLRHVVFEEGEVVAKGKGRGQRIKLFIQRIYSGWVYLAFPTGLTWVSQMAVWVRTRKNQRVHFGIEQGLISAIIIHSIFFAATPISLPQIPKVWPGSICMRDPPPNWGWHHDCSYLTWLERRYYLYYI